MGRRVSRQALSRFDRRFYGLILGVLLLVASACLLYLTQAGSAAALRYRLLVVEQEQDRLAEEIALLRTDLAYADRQEALDSRIERLGLVDAPLSGPYVVYYEPAAAPATAQASGPSQAAKRLTPIEWLWGALKPQPQRQAMRP